MGPKYVSSREILAPNAALSCNEAGMRKERSLRRAVLKCLLNALHPHDSGFTVFLRR